MCGVFAAATTSPPGIISSADEAAVITKLVTSLSPAPSDWTGADKFASSVSYLRSLLLTLLRPMGLSPKFDSDEVDEGLLGAVGSGLSSLILLAEQLNLDWVFSYRYGEDGTTAGSDCVVCLFGLRDSDQMRKLACRHIFHKDCFEGWLDHLNFNCPLWFQRNAWLSPTGA
ncbi:E3 ubiquitin-protein ligase RHA2A-like [Cornus florida]|uniref:E3 ubiquitin-protein ligase RHA2A-like n=1 Tax=Cornus florida TaxID=4283 RepID=UPI00289BBCDE|nr:E3 ubiquitin-protein ligase RHA2A-like [Cornus florida]